VSCRGKVSMTSGPGSSVLPKASRGFRNSVAAKHEWARFTQAGVWAVMPSQNHPPNFNLACSTETDALSISALKKNGIETKTRSTFFFPSATPRRASAPANRASLRVPRTFSSAAPLTPPPPVRRSGAAEKRWIYRSSPSSPTPYRPHRPPALPHACASQLKPPSLRPAPRLRLSFPLRPIPPPLPSAFRRGAGGEHPTGTPTYSLYPSFSCGGAESNPQTLMYATLIWI
jgi:hypothetical protein